MIVDEVAYLEENGKNPLNEFLEHYGVQGMKWGKRKSTNKANVARLQAQGLSKRQAKSTTRFQNRVDAQRMAATGRNGKVSVLRQLNNRAISNASLNFSTVLKHPLSAKKAANLQLEKNKKTQRKIINGEKRVTAALIKLGGVSIKDIDFSI